ncbi:MAG TPA: TlpA disulfide reductase family protein [Gemmatimonadaceae bacterium]|nr:TlpA disulfide reductase family protein [Gemmatimonadaceae bacterium]
MITHFSRVFSGAAAIALFIAVPVRAQDSGIEIGTKAPPVTLANTAGTVVSLANVIGKRPVLLEFWATWCENCKALEPRMMAAYKKYGEQVAFYGIAVSINQTLARVQQYVKKYNYPYPMLWDVKGDVGAAYDVPATSYVVVIDKSGKVVYTGAGGTQDLDAAIRKAM